MRIIVILLLTCIQTIFLFPEPIIKNFPPAVYGWDRQNWSVTPDDRGIMYFANSAGVLEFDSKTWRLIPLDNGVSAYSLARGPRGRIYVGGEGEIGYLEAYGSGSLRYRSLKEQIPPSRRGFRDRVFKIEVTPLGVVCLTDKFMFILKQRGRESESPPHAPEPPEAAVFNAHGHFYTFLYSHNTLYVIDTAGGLLRLQKGRLVSVPGGRLLRAHVMLPYEGGKLFIVTTHCGIVIFDPRAGAGSYTILKEIDHDFFKGNLVTCGILLGDDHIALGSNIKGMMIVDSQGRKITHINRDAGLQDNHVYGINRDGRGNTWLALDRGISLVVTDTFKKKKSIPFSALIRGCRKLIDETMVFNGAFYSQESGTPLTYQPRYQVPIFPFDTDAFRFTFASNNYREIEKTMYRCYLEGQDRDWSKWFERDSREYTNLHHRKYTLHVQARNYKGEISKEAVYTFRVRPPWHETWWFLVTQVTFIMALLLISRLIEKTGGSTRFSEFLVIFAIIIIFGYISGFLDPFIDRYSNQILFFKVFISGLTAVMLTPAEDLVKKVLDKIVKKKSKEK